MHQLAVVRVSALAVAAALAALPAAAQQLQPVNVLYAASLVTPMEGPVAAALRPKGVALSGEPGGSKKLANLILAGVRSPDVFISVDPAIVAALGSRVLSSATFARTSLGIAWSPKSRFADRLEAVAAGNLSLWTALATPGLRIGRTDPALDPKGEYTIRAVRAVVGGSGERELLGADRNAAQIFPEEDLLARVETGEIDAGFFYRTEAVARGYRFVPLPQSAASSIEYVLAVMRDAPHPVQARAFAAFVLHGAGRAILERAGLDYIRRLSSPDSR